MRRFYISVLICILFFNSPAEAFFLGKKDYKQNFLNDAYNAAKKKDYKKAFYSYEKAMYYYKKDKKIIESYAKFCENESFYDKAEDLYEKLYVLTKDSSYLFKSNLCSIKNGKIAADKIQKIINDKTLTISQQNDLSNALINHYAYKNNWKKVKKTCDSLAKNKISKEAIINCIVAGEKISDKKNNLNYYIRYHELYPKDSEIINKIIKSAEIEKKYKIQENFIKKLSEINPEDNGIKYQLAGFYEKQKDWAKAFKIYESLMISGDKSEHVTKSQAYVLSQLYPKVSTESQNVSYKPKPLSKFKIAEKKFYTSWQEKNYEKAQIYLQEMLKEQPNNKKLLKHKVDIDVLQNNFNNAIITFEKIKTSSLNDTKFLAFLYSKTKNYAKALEIIEEKLKEYPKNKILLNLALEYSLAQKNWDNAIIYNDKLLALEPESENLLKTGADLYSIKKDFSKAIKYYEKLVKHYPKIEYKMQLANLYMANHEFSSAETVLENLYYKNLNNTDITKAYLSSLLAQQKTYDAYKIIRDNNLLNTKEGYIILGDLNLKNEKYNTAANNYFKALEIDPKDADTKNNLAFCYRMLGYITGAANLYNEVLYYEPENKEAKLGLGSLEIDKKNYKKSREIFKSILNEHPDYKQAKIAIAHSYIANNEKLSALEILDELPDNDETKMMKAQIYYDFTMYTNSKETINQTNTKKAKELKYQIKKDQAINITPVYGLFVSELADAFNLDYQKYGVKMSQNTDNNSNVFMEYNVYWYTSGFPYFLSNVTNEFKGGIQSRINKKLEYKADIGVKAFQFGGGLINTDSWLKYYFNDKFNLKLGFYRNNIEQSYLSAVGQYIDGNFTGRTADNRLYLEFNANLAKQFYLFGKGSYGVITAQNLATNQYTEGMLGIGRRIYDNPKNKWVQTANFDIVSYNSAYQYNLLNIYNSTGVLYGGYFSPSYFNATTANIKVEGEIKNWHIKYCLSGFAGPQISRSPDFVKLSWGFSPYLSYEINDYISLNASYIYFNFADVQRHYLTFNAIFRRF